MSLFSPKADVRNFSEETSVHLGVVANSSGDRCDHQEFSRTSGSRQRRANVEFFNGAIKNDTLQSGIVRVCLGASELRRDFDEINPKTHV